MTEHVLPDLRLALVEGIATTRRRRRRRAAVLGASGVAAAMAALLLLLPGGDDSRALAVGGSSGWITIRIEDPAAGADAMNEELRAAGIDAEVAFVPASPARVGRWSAIGAYPRGGPIPVGDEVPPRPDVVRRGLVAIEPPGDLIRVDRVLAGELDDWRLVFYAGRAPEPGETVQTP